MIFDENGFVRVTHADDWADSPVLAAWLAILDHPNQIVLNKYYTDKGPVRYPFGKTTLENNPRCFSRDQTIMLVAGEMFQYKYSNFKPKRFANNDMDEVTGKWKMPDILSPSAYNHLKLCYGEKGSWLGYKFLELDIAYNAKHTPLREPNQLLALCLVAGPEYVKMYCAKTPQWREAVKLYWNDDRKRFSSGTLTEVNVGYNRGEPELTKAIVKYIEGYL